MPAVAGAVHQRLAGIEQSRIGRIQMRLADGAHALRRLVKILESRGGRGAKGRARPQPHPGFGDDAEYSFGTDEKPVGAGPGARARQSERFQGTGRSHHAQTLDEIVNVGVERGVVAAAAGGDPAAERGELEGLWEMAQRQAARLELAFQRRPKSAALYASRLRNRVDLEHAAEVFQVDGD